MTTITPSKQRQLDARFEHDITQHNVDLTFASETMILTVGTTLDRFADIKRLISPDAVLRRRNELARTFHEALRKHSNWSKDSQEAAAVVDWLLSFKKGKNVGGYVRALRPMVDLACRRLDVPWDQKYTWKKAVAGRPVCCPKDIAKQSLNALPRPSLCDVRS